MKVLTWNANMAFRKKFKKIFEFYNPDIMIIQECENPSTFNKEIFPHFLWIGDNNNKGLGIFSKYRLGELNHDKYSKYNIPFKINNYYFIGIWAMNNKINLENRYIGQVYNLLNNYNNLLKENVIIIGDFNWNIIWDKNPSYPLSGNFNDVISLLNKYNIHSIYHHTFNKQFGFENDPTYYMHKNINKPYHIDYIFIKNDIKYDNFQIGLYTDWIKLSDHMPIAIDIIE